MNKTNLYSGICTITFLLALWLYLHTRDVNVSPEVKKSISKTSKAVEKPSKVILHSFNYDDLAKYTISVVMGRSPKTMSVIMSNDIYIVSYVRPSDSKRFSYRVKFEGNTAIWANIDGRWRTHIEDEIITFTESKEKVTLHQAFRDGSYHDEDFFK